MENNKSNGIFLLVSAIILAGVFLFVGLSLTSSLKNNQQTSQGITNTISVMGEGKASVAPDMLVISVSISELAATTELAQTQADEKVNKLQALLKTNDISDKDIKTTNVNVYPEYDRRGDNGRKLLGYRAQQSISINVSGEGFGEKGGNIVSQISKIGGVNVDNTYFDLKDKDAAYQAARDKAFVDAKTKAEQLAKAGGVTLGKPVMISDSNSSYNPPIYYAKAMGGEMALDEATSSALSPGETEVTINVSVVYEIK